MIRTKQNMSLGIFLSFYFVIIITKYYIYARHVSPPQRQGVIQRHQKPSSPSFVGADMQHSYALSGKFYFIDVV